MGGSSPPFAPQTTRTLGPDLDLPALEPVEPRLVGRYALTERIGRGGFGEVWRATDTRLGEEVAIKLIHAAPGPQLSAVRRELGALRWLRIPGVVRMRDDGVDQGRYYLVMDLVLGAPFPGLTTPTPWRTVRGPLVALLEILAQVHAAGVVHRDLKPANILVTPEGRPVVLDFGIARGRALAPERSGRVEATLAYAPPEQLTGAPMDARGDLYALGLIVHEALTGLIPHADGSFFEIVTRRANEPAPSLGRLRPDLPPELIALVDALLRPRPADRPADAETCLAMLGLRADAVSAGPALARLPAEGPVSEAEIARLFRGPDRFLHVAEDASRLLRARSGGAPGAVAEEIARWCRAGLCHWEADGLALERPALDRLLGLSGEEEGGRSAEEAALRDAIRADAPADLLLERAERAGRALLAAGRLERARATLELALDLARQEEEGPEVEAGLLRLLCAAALSQETPAALDGALLEIERSEHASRPAQEELTRLVLAARAAYQRNGAAAAPIIERLPPLSDPELEIWRQAVRLLVALQQSPAAEASLLAELEGWADPDRTRRAKLDGWLGNRAYRQLRFEEAARLHERSAAGKDRPDARLSSLVNAAQSWLEAGDLGRAAALAAQTATLAATLRRPRLELMSAWVLRQCAYREDRAGEPDLGLVEGALPVDQHLAAGVAMTEAAVAWRLGRDALAAELAGRSTRLWRALAMKDLEVLTRALALAAGADEDAAALAEAAREATYPRLGLQSLGLIRLARGEMHPAWQAWAEALLRRLGPAEDPRARREVLSIAEARGARPVARGTPSGEDPRSPP